VRTRTPTCGCTRVAQPSGPRVQPGSKLRLRRLEAGCPLDALAAPARSTRSTAATTEDGAPQTAVASIGSWARSVGPARATVLPTRRRRSGCASSCPPE